MEGDRTAETYLRTPSEENNPIFSPDGKWVAYESLESGRPEIVVNSFPTPGRRYPVSRETGRFPIWQDDGKQIFFADNANALVACSVSWTETEFRAETPRSLGAQFPSFLTASIAPDGRFRLLSLPEEGGQSSAPLTVVLDWQEELSSK